jgi:hypothetical protein
LHPAYNSLSKLYCIKLNKEFSFFDYCVNIFTLLCFSHNIFQKNMFRNLVRFFHISEKIYRHSHLGLPQQWCIILAWLTAKPPPPPPPSAPQPKIFPRKHPSIPLLSQYHTPPPPQFWEFFPYNPLPVQPTTPILIDVFSSLIAALKPYWTLSQRRIAETALHDLRFGASPVWEAALPPITCQNSPTAIFHGALVTDTIASWILEKFVAGPFQTPPFSNFRCNALIAVPQSDKIRPVLDLSSPSGSSYNDALCKTVLRKAVMSSAKLFSRALWTAGRHSYFSKFDMHSAYKNIPQRPSLWPAQGFSWLGRFFVDTTTVFGSSAAVIQFDTFAHTVQIIAQTAVPIPNFYIHRVLDDLPILCPSHSDLGRRFTAAYLDIARKCNIILAPPCPQRQKAFYNSTAGLVLGVWFDSSDLTWQIPTTKLDGIRRLIHTTLCHTAATLHTVEELLGFLNYFSQHCEFFQGLRSPLQYYHNAFADQRSIHLPIPTAVRQDLATWHEALLFAAKPLPIVPPPKGPPLNRLLFTSDAAAGIYPSYPLFPHAFPPRGAASIGGDSVSSIFSIFRLTWPPSLLATTTDHVGGLFGHKSTTLETIALLLPLLAQPQLCRHRYIVLVTDNLSIASAWPHRHASHDPETSLLIRCLHILSTYLECVLYIQFQPRCSSPLTTLADYMTRHTTPPPHILCPTTNLSPLTHPSLFRWLLRPHLDWNLPLLLLHDLSIFG